MTVSGRRLDDDAHIREAPVLVFQHYVPDQLRRGTYVLANADEQ